VNIFRQAEMVGFFLNEDGFETIGKDGAEVFVFSVEVYGVRSLERVENDSQ